MHRLDLPRGVQKTLDKLPLHVREKLHLAMLQLKENPRPYDSEKLTSVPLWRIREGIYRIIYNINDKEKIVTVVKIGHRREIYRDLY